jgi:hypothetical protein
MRSLLVLFPLALGACTPAEDTQAGNGVAPAEPAVVGSAQSAAEGQMIAEEQAKAAEQAGENAGTAQ